MTRQSSALDGDRIWRSEDLYRIRIPETAEISPDGRQVAYVEMKMPDTTWDYKRSIFTVGADGSTPRRLTQGTTDDAPRWSPDGRLIAFERSVSRAKDYAAIQIFTVSPDGEKPRQITDFPDGCSDAAWSPDGRHLLVTANQHEVQDPAAWSAQRRGLELPGMRTIREPYFKSDDEGFVNDWRCHIWVVDTNTNSTWQLTDSAESEMAGAWSPDGTQVAFVRTGLSTAMQPTYSIWVTDLRTRVSRPLTDEKLDAGAPVWSPDGSAIAFMGSTRVGSQGHEDVYVIPSSGGRPRNLTAGRAFTTGDSALDDMRSHTDIGLAWSPDGTSVIAPVSVHGTTQLVSLSAVSGSPGVTYLTAGDHHIYSASASRDGRRIALGIASDTSPGEIHMLRGNNRPRIEQLTGLNDELLSERVSVAPEQLTVQARDGTPIQAWILRAQNAEDALAPTVIAVHGGPACMYGHSFMLEFQLLAARGYNVVFSNPRGSTGYGRAFSGAVFGDSGGEDFQDILAATDAAIAAGGVDPKRLVISGGSYGGFMANWAIGQTRRFAGAIADRSISDLSSVYGTADYGATWEEEHSGTPWSARSYYLKRSPITSVAKICTPLLLIHGEEDLRCPVSQAEQMFVALRKLGQDVELVRFEGQSHELSRSGHPRLRVMRYDKILSWLDARVGPRLSTRARPMLPPARPHREAGTRAMGVPLRRPVRAQSPSRRMVLD